MDDVTQHRTDPTGVHATFDATCEACRVRSTMKPSAGHLSLFTHGVVVLEWYCIRCRAHNRLPVEGTLGQDLTAIGVPTNVVQVPAELLDLRRYSNALPAISQEECMSFQRISMPVFWLCCRRELGM